MSNKVNVEITYNSRGLLDILVGDSSLNIEPIRGKGINEWFIPFNGRVSWNGLISEIKDFLQDDEAELEFEFLGNSENKAIFEDSLKKNELITNPNIYKQILQHTEEVLDTENNEITIKTSNENRIQKANEMENQSKIDEDVNSYLSLAQNGNASAQFKLGYFYDNGISVSEDKLLALYWYQKAAYQGHEEAKLRIARLEGKNCDTSFFSD